MTRLIVTIGPSSIEKNILLKLKQAGAQSFRINLSHSSKQSLSDYISVMKDCGITAAIDTQGAQLRIDTLRGNNVFSAGEFLSLRFDSYFESSNLKNDDLPSIVFNHPEVFEQFSVGDFLKVDFGGLIIKLVEQRRDCWIAQVTASGVANINRAVDVSGKSLKLSPLTKFDEYAIDYAISVGVQEVYGSFVSSLEDVRAIKDKLPENVKLVSKIETAVALSNAIDIMNESDAVLVDRGDLSREISIPSVPIAVNAILGMSRSVHCPVYIATNVLDSMMQSPLPSRAEISDIFSLLDQGAAGLVLAAEVAIGKNPVASASLVDYLSRLYENHRHGLFKVAHINKPDPALIGEQLHGWI